MNNRASASSPVRPYRHHQRGRVRPALILLLCLALAPTCKAGLKLYFLRHAEAGHNVLQEWQTIPRDQWPAYVGNPDAFTPKGITQVSACTRKLKEHRFDFIAVSPTWRTRNTVAPYLRETAQVAEVWPELLEFGSLDQQHDFDPLPPPSPNLFAGDPIRLAQADATLFKLREDGHRHFKLSQSPAQKAADRWAVVQKDIALIQKRFGGSDKSILLVSHGNLGCLLLEALTGNRGLLQANLLNTSLWMAEEQVDNTFKLRLLNDSLVQ